MKKLYALLITAFNLSCQSPSSSSDISLPAVEPWRQRPSPQEEMEMQEMLNHAGSFAWYKEEDTKRHLRQKGTLESDIQRYLAVNDFKGLLYQKDPLLGSPWLNDPKTLEALIYVESSGRANVGCNAKGACGPGQVKNNGYTEVIRLLFGDHKEAREFREKHSPKLVQLTNLFDAISGWKLGRLREHSVLLREFREGLSQGIAEMETSALALESSCQKISWAGGCSQDYVAIQDALDDSRLLNRLAFSLYTLLQNSLNQTYAPARQDYSLRSSLLASSITASLMDKLSGKKEDWAAVLNVQEEIARGWKETMSNPWFNLLVADVHLAHYIDYFGDEQLGLEAYNSGLEAVKARLNKEKRKIAKGNYQNKVAGAKESFGRHNIEVYGEQGGQDLNCNHEFNPCFGEWFSEKK